MTQLANNFAGGTDGVTLTQGSGGNTGGASGDYFDNVSKNADAILAFTNVHAYEGSLAVRLAIRTAGAAASYFTWTTRRGSLTDDYLRFFLYCDDVTQGGIAHGLVKWLSGTNNAGGVFLGNGFLYVTDGSAGGLSTSFRTAVSAGQWYRIEIHHHADPTAGSCELRVFSDPTSSTPSATVTRTGLTHPTTTTDRVYFGDTGTTTANWPSSTGYLYLDGIVDGASTWVGPLAGSTVALTPTFAGTSSLAPSLQSLVHRQLTPAFAGKGTLTASLALFGPTPPATGGSRILLENGSLILLEDGFSAILRETQVVAPIVPGRGPSGTYLVEVSWGQSWATGGLFTFGSSAFGGPDTFAASAWSGAFNVPFGDLTSMARQIQIVRGRDNLLSTMQAGALTLDLSDPTGLLNLRNPASPLAGTLYTGVPIRVSAYTSAGVWTPLYYGFISTLTSDPGGRYGTAQITAIDFFDRLRRERPNLGALTLQTTGSLLQNLLEAIGWTDPNMIDLATGDVLPSSYTRADGTNDVLGLVEEALQTERGYFFVSGSGAVTYRSRYQVLQGASQTTLDRVMTAAPSTLDAARIVNRWTVNRTDMAGNPIGVPQVAAVDPVNDVSYRRYHYIDDSITTPLLVSDNQALSLAQYLLSMTKDPGGVGWQVPISPADDATLDQMILRDLGDRVTLTVDPLEWPAYTADYTIQQIQHTITTDPTRQRHVTTWGLAEVSAVNPFTFGVSKFGGSDVLVY